MKKGRPPEVCPVCGEDVPPNAKACPECGADEKSGWRPDALTSDALDLPDDDFDYHEFIEQEFGGGKSKLRPATIWVVAAAILVVVLLWLYLEIGRAHV